jgi:hypothetical protein
MQKMPEEDLTEKEAELEAAYARNLDGGVKIFV